VGCIGCGGRSVRTVVSIMAGSLWGETCMDRTTLSGYTNTLSISQALGRRKFFMVPGPVTDRIQRLGPPIERL